MTIHEVIAIISNGLIVGIALGFLIISFLGRK